MLASVYIFICQRFEKTNKNRFIFSIFYDLIKIRRHEKINESKFV